MESNLKKGIDLINQVLYQQALTSLAFALEINPGQELVYLHRGEAFNNL